ncbi:uncharacterized protein SPPG_00866 [Spizellomyces punctatus DAOM BR117]|uniref:Uncharacterized protein n=1 Tax=Spizellomyces punctatus (strain DAOM BR117) TaxID=645134 RepID=A0A0L0HV33_SPIPD|nr:uncharacterized protein SPPG_00866 [Spizellomyces punctatus DAOM BR117]KND05206.1 hypothetical protein SPPG_00866 [Spizellomyces punctatus DAOM BR117]|eukprot:XP_016613245.1 hypothetical protein SPPG_00866 [Spizellomyces punctatus DAOM BR117]
MTANNLPPPTNVVRDVRADFMSLLNLDVHYHRGEGDVLYHRPHLPAVHRIGKKSAEEEEEAHDEKQEEEIAVLDALGGYGSTILGHNHSAPKQELLKCLTENAVMHAQFSRRNAAEELGEHLNDFVQEAWRTRDDDDISPNSSRNRSESEGSTMVATEVPAYKAILVNTGTEAVEAAIKHALLDWHRRADEALIRLGGPTLHPYAADALANLQPVVIAVEGSFHGKTAGSLGLTFKSQFRAMYASTFDHLLRDGGDMKAPSPAFEVVHLKRNASVQEISDIFNRYAIDIPGKPPGTRLPPVYANDNHPVLKRFSRVVAFIYEPVQGEAGIHPLSRELLSAVHACCVRDGHVPIVADEIQSGLYRTGAPLACTAVMPREREFPPEYILLGKSLGGGLAKVAACMVRSDRWQQDFTIVHTSTFAEDDLSSRVSLAAIKALQQEASDGKLAKRSKEFETRLKQLGSALKAKYPHIVTDVRGKGFFMGVELGGLLFEKSLPNALEVFATYDAVGYLLASFLLHRHHVRVGAALGATGVLRIEPSCFAQPDYADKIMSGIDHACHLIDKGYIVDLTAHMWTHSGCLLGDKTVSLPNTNRNLASRRQYKHLPVTSFLSHALGPDSLVKADPLFARLSRTDVERFLRISAYFPAEKFMSIHEMVVEGNQGQATILRIVYLPGSAAYFEHCLRTGNVDAAQRVRGAFLQEAIRGSKVVGLGAFTSIVTLNGTLLPQVPGCPATTGNSLTTASAIEALSAHLHSHKMNPSKLKVAVVGAAGNIGSVLAATIAPHFESVTLVHRQGVEEAPKFRAVAEEIAKLRGGRRTTTTKPLAHGLNKGPSFQQNLSLSFYRVLAKFHKSTRHLPEPLGSNGLLSFVKYKQSNTKNKKQNTSSSKIHARLAQKGILATQDMSAVRDADVILAAANVAHGHVLTSEHLKRGAVVLDLSAPTVVDPSVFVQRPDVVCIVGGFCSMPKQQQFYFPAGLAPEGLMYACLAETLSSGLAGSKVALALGSLTEADVRKAAQMAHRVGVTPARGKIGGKDHGMSELGRDGKGVDVVHVVKKTERLNMVETR